MGYFNIPFFKRSLYNTNSTNQFLKLDGVLHDACTFELALKIRSRWVEQGVEQGVVHEAPLQGLWEYKP